jgi:hypothetical protein
MQIPGDDLLVRDGLQHEHRPDPEHQLLEGRHGGSGEVPAQHRAERPRPLADLCRRGSRGEGQAGCEYDPHLAAVPSGRQQPAGYTAGGAGEESLKVIFHMSM